jgi:hypothetical protein
MKYFRHETNENRLTLYPIVCMHIGAAQADIDFIKEHLYRFKHDPSGRLVYMGDGGECVTRISKGDVFSQTMNPTEQLKYVKNLLQPFKDRLLFCIDGNHGRRTYKETGLGWDETLALSLQVPYLGPAAFWRLKIKQSTYSIYTHHGIDSGVSISTKINKAKALDNLVIADAILSAHSHICCEIPPVARAILADVGHRLHDPIQYINTREYICGCAYDSRTGYAEEKGYPPILPAYMTITFGGSRTKDTRIPIKSQSCTVYRREP